MTDLEMTRLCAEAMGDDAWTDINGRWYCHVRGQETIFAPLIDDAQAMALDDVILLDNHGYQITPDAFTRYSRKGEREVFTFRSDMTKPENRRRARVECVAKMQEAANV